MIAWFRAGVVLVRAVRGSAEEVMASPPLERIRVISTCRSARRKRYAGKCIPLPGECVSLKNNAFPQKFLRSPESPLSSPGNFCIPSSRPHDASGLSSSVRTTLTIGDDIMAQINNEMRRSGKSFKEDDQRRSEDRLKRSKGNETLLL